MSTDNRIRTERLAREARVMPTDDCWFFYICQQCSVALQPLASDCWAFYSFADVPYPPPIRSRRRHGQEGRLSHACCV
ncbi:GDCCVxC domain-containing (seleno)protein [Pelagerythrobacter aerophilus]